MNVDVGEPLLANSATLRSKSLGSDVSNRDSEDGKEKNDQKKEDAAEKMDEDPPPTPADEPKPKGRLTTESNRTEFLLTPSRRSDGAQYIQVVPNSIDDYDGNSAFTHPSL
jgi:hypothetical protein